MKKRIISMFIAVAVIITTMPTITLTAGAAVSGIGWHFSNGTLTISTDEGTTAWRTGRGFATFQITDVTTVVIENSVETIGNWAFYGCTSLVFVTIGNGVEAIGGEFAFIGCTSLESIDVDINNPNFSSIDGVLFNKEQTALIQYPAGNTRTSYTIPDSVRSIGNSAFSLCTSLESIVIPDSVTSIETAAFYGCTSLESIVIPNSVRSIGDNAFYGCTSLVSVTIGNSVETIESGAFRNCTSLKSVIIGNSVTSIGSLAFTGCTSLESIVIPDNVTRIGNSAFQGCTSLVSVTIGNGVTSIRNYMFLDCTSLESVTIGNGVTSIDLNAFRNTALLDNQSDGVVYIGNIACTWKGTMPEETSITLKEGTRIIADDAFRSSINLISITIPDSVETIGNYAFYGCTSLESIVIPDSVTSIGYSAFSNCTSLESIVIPDSVTSIRDWAFAGCTSLESVTIGNSVETIGGWAFRGCTSLESIVIPDSVETIGMFAFSDCTSLESIVIPDSVTSIGHFAFIDCTSLESVTIGNGVTSIGNYAFDGCTSLETVSFRGETPPEFGFSVFWDTPVLTTIFVPLGAAAAYQAVPQLRFYEIIEIDMSCTDCNKHPCECEKAHDCAALGHKFGAWNITVTATTSRTGSRERICEVCEHKETETIARLTGGGGGGGGGGSSTPTDTPTTPTVAVTTGTATWTVTSIPRTALTALGLSADIPVNQIRIPTGATGNTSVSVGADYIGQNAVLVQLNAETNELEFVSASTVGANGNASINIRETGDFLVLTFKTGDITGTGEVDTGDALAVLRDVAGIAKLNSIQSFVANGGKGDIGTNNALDILRLVAGIVDRI